MRSTSPTLLYCIGRLHVFNILAWLLFFYCIILSASSQLVTATPTPYPEHAPLQHYKSNLLNKRQESSQCGANGNSDTICAPKSGDTWQNGTWYQIIWNPSYPTYVSSTSLDIYLYFVENYQNKMIKNWTDIDPSQGKLPILVDDSFFAGQSSSPQSSTSVIHQALIYIAGANVDPEREMVNRDSRYPQPVSLSIVQPPGSTSSSTGLSSSAASTNTTSNSNNSSGPKTLEPWVIALVVVACVAVVAACITIVVTRRSLRRRKMVFDEKSQSSSVNNSPPGTATQIAPIQDKSSSQILGQHNSSSYFIAPPTIRTAAPDSNCLTSRVTGSAISAEHLSPPFTASNISARSIDTPPPLTSMDALIIADTFRQRMRKPEWHGNPFSADVDPDDEEARRHHLSQELMKKELAEEGTMMKKVGKRAHLFNIQSFAEGSENLQNNQT